MEQFVLALLIGNVLTVSVDRSPVVSSILNTILNEIFWYYYRDVAGDDVNLMYRLALQNGAFLIIVGWWVQYLKRRVFFQAHCMERNSERWLSFLSAHPDPIAIFSKEQ